MNKLSTKDYWTLATFFIMVSFLMFSFVNSEFFPENRGITGMAIVSLSEEGISYAKGYTPSEYNQPFVDSSIIFYITITNNSNGNPLSNAQCSIKIANSNNFNMIYRQNLGQYEFAYLFSSTGTFSYTITCDLSSYGKNEITTTGSITVKNKLPDFILEIEAPGTSSIDGEVKVKINAKNQGPGNYQGPLKLEINYGDENKETKEIQFSGEETNAEFSHSYDYAGDYIISAKINSDNAVNEINTSNNIAEKKIEIIDSKKQDMVCGEISSSISMDENFYCRGDIIITASDIVLDCKNHRIYGDGSNSGRVGIHANFPATIKNCEIDRYAIGINAKSPINLVNSTIKRTLTGLILNSTGNKIKHNIFEDNTVAIKNIKESTIKSNDFKHNTINLETLTNTDFTKNYFSTTIYKSIIEKIENKTNEVQVIPFMDGSARLSSSKELSPDITGPKINATITTSERNYITEVVISVESDKPAKCRFSDRNIAYSRMNEMSSSNKINHYKTLIYSQKRDLKVYVICKDNYDNPSDIYESRSISIRSSLDIALEHIDEEIRTHESKIEIEKNEKERLQEDLAEQENPLIKEEIDRDISKKNIEIRYLERLIENIKNLKSQLTNLRNKQQDINRDFLDKYQSEFRTLKNNIKTNQEEISDVLELESDEIRTLVPKRLDFLKELYELHERNDTKTKEKNLLENEHTLFILNKQLNELEITIWKFEELFDLGEANTLPYIESLEEEILDINYRIIDARDDNTIDEFMIKIDFLNKRIVKTTEYREHLREFIHDMNKAIEYSENYNRFSTAQSLLTHLNSINNLMNDLHKEIIELNDELEKTKRKLDEFELSKDKVTPTERGRIRINVDSSRMDGHIAEIILNPSMSLTKAEVFFETQNKTMYSIDILSLRENPFSDTEDFATFEWYNISSSKGLEILTAVIHFKLDKATMNKWNVSSDEIALFKYNHEEEEWIIKHTNYTSSNQDYNFISIFNGDGYFALGYLSNNTKLEIPQACIPQWECEEWSICDEENNQTRICREINECKQYDLERQELRECTDEDEKEEPDEKDEDEKDEDEKDADKEQPDIIFPEEPRKPIFRTILIIMIFLGLGGMLAIKIINPKKPQATELKEIEQEKKDYFDYNLINKIIEELFKYTQLPRIKYELISKGAEENHAEYLIQITNFIFERLEKNITVGELKDDLKKKGWKHDDAVHITKYIAARYLMKQIDEYYESSEENEQEDEIIKDIFRSDGYSEKIISLAFNLHEYNKNLMSNNNIDNNENNKQQKK